LSDTQTDTAYCKKFVIKFVMRMIVVVVMVKATASQLALTLVGITANMFIPHKYGPVMTHADYA
jgi:hypothetical protein